MREPMNCWKRLAVVLLVAAGLGPCPRLPAGTGEATNAFTRQPYVQLATPQSIYIVWRTEGPITPVVKYGKTPEKLDRIVSGAAIRLSVSLGRNPTNMAPAVVTLRTPTYARLPKMEHAPAGTVQYEAAVRGLDPNTRYYYAVFDGSQRLTPEDPSYSFATHPKPGEARRTLFWVVGDSGVGREPQSSVHRVMVDWVKRGGKPLDFLVHVGDMAYPKGRDPEFQARFFEMYEPTLRSTVCWPAMGNHEGITSRGTNGVGPYYDAYVLPTRGEAGGLASGSEAFYSFDYGRIHFICLDSHDLDRSPGAAMARWLKADLDRTRADWLIAFWHHPPYTKGSHDSDKEKQLVEMRKHIMPIIESGGVDLVLTGHSHIYERSMLMDGAYDTPTVAANVILDDGDGHPYGDGPYRKSAGLHPNQGAIQVVAGHGGAKLNRKGTMPVMKKIILEHGSVLIDVQGDTLTGVMINKDGQERDRFNLVKRGEVTLTRLSNPRVLDPYVPPKSAAEDGEIPPEEFVVLIEKNEAWDYLAGSHPANTNWTDRGVLSEGWKRGRAAFGYHPQRRHETVLSDMQGRYSVVYLRREFEVENPDYVSEIGLLVDYQDGFIVYLNGGEVLRRNVGRGRGAEATSIRAHELNGYRFFPFKDFEKHLRQGRNTLAIEGHSRSLESSQFTLDPSLIMED